MKYKSDLKKHLRVANIKDEDISWELSYRTNSSLKYFTKYDVVNYINLNYINDNRFEKKELINDLITFKTYRDYIKKNITIQDILEKFLAIAITVDSILVAVFVGFFQSKEDLIKEYKRKGFTEEVISDFIDKYFKKLGEDYSWTLKVLLFLFLVYFIFLVIRSCKKSEVHKLIVFNNAIYVLEAIKEDMVKVHGTTYEVNVDNYVGEKSEPRKYLVDVDEILEDKINEDTIEGKNESIEKINL